MNTAKIEILKVDTSVATGNGSTAALKTSLPHPIIHHPISDAILTMTNPYEDNSDTKASEYRFNAYLQAVTHMGLMYVEGMTPELVTSHIGEDDIRNGQWFPAYRSPTADDKSLAYSYAIEILTQNKFAKTTTTVDSTTGLVTQKVSKIDRSTTSAPHYIYMAAAATLTRLPATETTTIATSDTSDRIVLIKDASGSYFFCPLVKPGANWHGAIVRPQAFGGSGKLYKGNGDTACPKYMTANAVHASFLELNEGGITATNIYPKLKTSPVASTLSSGSSQSAVIGVMFDALKPVLPTAGESVALPFATKVYSTVKTSGVSTKELHVDHILVSHSQVSISGFLNKTSSLVQANIPVTTFPKPHQFVTTALFDTTDTKIIGLLSVGGSALTNSPFKVGA